MIKVGANYGCANGGMMDSMSLSRMDEEGNEDWEPEVVGEVDEQTWANWEAFLELHDYWEKFWDKNLKHPRRKSKAPAP